MRLPYWSVDDDIKDANIALIVAESPKAAYECKYGEARVLCRRRGLAANSRTTAK